MFLNKTTMNFKTLRESGNLSDLTVVVDETNYNLHKFPLFTKSEYFCEIAQPDQGKQRVVLRDFPGGSDVFSIVADFCYNVKVDVTKNNVVELRCAAKFLRMMGDDNLGAVCDKFIGDYLTTAKLSRSVDIISTLLLHCKNHAAQAEECGIVDLCIQALVDCWLKPRTKFIAPSRGNRASSNDAQENEDRCTREICQLPHKWLCNLLTACRDQQVDVSKRCQIMCAYIDEIGQREKTTPITGETETNLDDKNANADLDLAKDTNRDIQLVEHKEENSCDQITSSVDNIIHEVICALGSDIDLSKYLTMAWIARVIKLTSKNCLSRPYLLEAAVKVIQHASDGELVHVTPGLMQTIGEHFRTAESEKSGHNADDMSCDFLDKYMKLLADRGELTPEQFCKLAHSERSTFRHDHDRLFDIMQTLMERGDRKPTEDEQNAMTSIIDFQQLTEYALEKALARGLMPTALVAKTALSLCAKLRKELEMARTTIQTQNLQLDVAADSNPGEICTDNLVNDTCVPSGFIPRKYFDYKNTPDANLRPRTYLGTSALLPRHYSKYTPDLRVQRAMQTPLSSHGHRTFNGYELDESLDIDDVELSLRIERDALREYADADRLLRRSMRQYGYKSRYS